MANEKENKKSTLSLSVAIGIIQTAILILSTAYGFTKSVEDKTFLPIISVMIAVYFVLFVVMVVISIKDGKQAVKETTGEFKQRNKDFKLTIKVIDVTSSLIACVTSFLIVYATYTSSDKATLFQVFALLSAGISLLSAIWAGIKTAKKVKKRVDKSEKSKEKNK